jgi:hypothetical protein
MQTLRLDDYPRPHHRSPAQAEEAPMTETPKPCDVMWLDVGNLEALAAAETRPTRGRRKWAMTEPVKRFSDGELWSFLRSVLQQGRSIEQDNAAGVYARHEQLSARIDAAASERVEEWNRRATGQTEREAAEPSEAMVESLAIRLARWSHDAEPFDVHRRRARALLILHGAALTPPQDSRSLASTPPEKER